MKKIIPGLLLLFSATFFYAQEEDFDELDSLFDGAQDVEFAESIEVKDEDFDIDSEFDELDALFEDAQDVQVGGVSAAKSTATETSKTTVKNVADVMSKTLKISGNVSADLGIAAYITPDNKGQGEDKKVFAPGAFFTFENYLNIDAVPSNVFKIHARIYTALKQNSKTNFTLSVDSFYFDYLMLNALYLSVGKKSISWGNTRIFNNTDYYGSRNGPQYTNILADTGGYAKFQLRYPWSYGNVTAIAMYPYTKAVDMAPGFDKFTYALSADFVVFKTNINLFTRFNGNFKDENNYPYIGLELKRTFFGADFYGQVYGLVRDINEFNHTAGYRRFIGTAGFYKLWDKTDPQYGINIEYQMAMERPLLEDKPEYNHRIAMEAGVKRLGPKKNHKIGLLWNHSFTDKLGQLGINYKVSGLIPHAQIDTKAMMLYGGEINKPSFQLACGLSFDAKY